MRGLRRHRMSSAVAAAHAFVQNLGSGHYELATDVPSHWRLAAAFTELGLGV